MNRKLDKAGAEASYEELRWSQYPYNNLALPAQPPFCKSDCAGIIFLGKLENPRVSGCNFNLVSSKPYSPCTLP
jgi:hypothetical protein